VRWTEELQELHSAYKGFPMLYYQATLKTEDASRERGRVESASPTAKPTISLLQEENIATKYK